MTITLIDNLYSKETSPICKRGFRNFSEGKVCIVHIDSERYHPTTKFTQL